MKTTSEIRRDRLRQLVQRHGGISALNVALGRSARDSTFSQILNQATNSKGGKPKVMGDRMARGIEERLCLQPGWMDTEEDPDYEDQESGFTPLPPKSPLVTIARYDTGGAMGSGTILRDQPGIIERLEVS